MSLTGNLEDLPLLDIMQIVSFSKKTGYLAIDMAGGKGGIVFREGLVVAAFTAGSPPADPRSGDLPPEKREPLIRSRIVYALEHLARLREGAFGFELTSAVPRTLGSRDLTAETLAGGINPQDLLLDLAAGMDEGLAESAAAVEASFAAPEEGVVGVDPADTSPITRSVAPPDVDAPAEPTAPPPADPGSLTADLSALVTPASPPVPETPVAPAPSIEPRKPPGPDETIAPGDSLEPPAPPASEPPAAPPAPPVPATPAPAPPPSMPAEAAPAPPSETPAEASPAPDAPPTSDEPAPGAAPPEARALLLVDDEPDVRAILAHHFAEAGYRIEEAGDPESAAKLAGRLRAAGFPFVLVTDLGMPSSGGASFHGGFEVVKRLWKMNLRPPILMMTESLNQSLRLRARQMGIQAFVFKPTLSKLNPRQFEADLSAFAGKLASDVLPRLAEVASLRRIPPPRKGHRPPDSQGLAGPPAEDAVRPFEFLRRRLRDLRQPGDANEIAALVMKVAREFFERSILFVVKNDQARGLGGFGLAPREETLNLLARQIAIPLLEPSVFRDVVSSRRAFAGPLPPDRWSGHLMGRVGRFQSGGIAILPLLAHRETIALLFGDNPESGRPIAGLEALEVFVHQAGIALENVFLQRRLQALQEHERADRSAD